MIEIYKIITEKYESKSANVVFNMNKNTFTRGNRFKLFHQITITRFVIFFSSTESLNIKKHLIFYSVIGKM